MKLIDRVLLVVGFGRAGAGLWWMWSGWDITSRWKGLGPGGHLRVGHAFRAAWSSRPVARAVMRLSRPQRATLAADAAAGPPPQPKRFRGWSRPVRDAVVAPPWQPAAPAAEEKPEPSGRIDEPRPGARSSRKRPNRTGLNATKTASPNRTRHDWRNLRRSNRRRS